MVQISLFLLTDCNKVDEKWTQKCLSGIKIKLNYTKEMFQKPRYFQLVLLNNDLVIA